jgi:hypothetical protein
MRSPLSGIACGVQLGSRYPQGERAMHYPLYQPSFARAHAPSDVSELLGRYPDLSEDETERLAAMLPKVAALDMSLMLADDDLLPRLEAFYAEHRDQLVSPLTEGAVIAAIFSLPLVIALTYVLAGALS